MTVLSVQSSLPSNAVALVTDGHLQPLDHAAIVQQHQHQQQAHHHHHHNTTHAGHRRHHGIAVRMAVIFTLLFGGSIALVAAPMALGVGTTPLWLLGLWPCTTYGIFAVSYFKPRWRLAVRLLQKNRLTGAIPVWRMLLLLPPLLTLWLFWLVKHLCVQNFREEPYDQVSETIFLGRYPMKMSEFPVCHVRVD